MSDRLTARVSPRVCAFRCCSGPGSAWSGHAWEGAEPGQDLGEQVLAGRQAQGEAAGVVDQAARDGDQPLSQGGDHGLAAAPTWLK
jgi:hypothetical protein